MSDGTFIEALYDKFAKPSQDVVGRVYVPTGWTESRRAMETLAPVGLNSLTGFVEYVKTAEIDSTHRTLGAFVHVESPIKVALRLSAETIDERYRRTALAVATTEMLGAPTIAWGAQAPVELMVIFLQTWFVADAARDALLRVIGNVKDETVAGAHDDGVTQQVHASRGVAFKDNIAVPNPVTLRPFRTFREVEQPASVFVVRAKAGQEGGLPTFALHEADGGQWKLEAMQTVAAYLKTALPGETVLA